MKKLLSVVLMLIGTSTALAKDVPRLKGRVNDYGNVLSSLEENQLEKALKTQEEATSNQIAILTVESLEGETLEEYTIKVAETWKLGQANKDNGVLIFQAKKERKIRLEVGYGMEEFLTDAVCAQIIRNEMTPKFKDDDYAGGYRAAINSINLAVKGQYKVESAEVDGTTVAIVVITLIFLIFIVIILLEKSGIDVSDLFDGSYGMGGGFGGSGGGGGFFGGGGGFGGGGASGGY